jgi:polyisoprenoid-binding protein YceI
MRAQPEASTSGECRSAENFWIAAALPPLFPSRPRRKTPQREAPPGHFTPRKIRRHSEERFLRPRISSMLPRRNRNDEDALDAVASAEQYWMRFFASLRMTAHSRARLKERLLFSFFHTGTPQLTTRRVPLKISPMRRTLLLLVCSFASLIFPTAALAQSPAAGIPTFLITPDRSQIKFAVKASVSIAGKFDAWDGTLTFQSPDVTTGVLDIKISADSVDTGSGMKNGKLKGKDFFDAANNPSITFHSTKMVATSPTTIEVDGDFTIRGATLPEKLTLVVSHKEGHLSEIEGKMTFNRKDYGMNKGIPFVKIGDHVDVTFNLKVKHTGGPQVELPNKTVAQLH